MNEIIKAEVNSNIVKKEKRVITLKEIVDVINADRIKKGLGALKHSKQMLKVDKMIKESDIFGWCAKVEHQYASGKGRVDTIETYYLTKTQALVIGAVLDIDRAVLIVKRLEELEEQNKVKLPSYEIEDPIARAKRWIEEAKITKALEAKVTEDAPKVDFYDTVTGSSDAIDIGKVAKLLNKNIGRNKLFAFLRKKKILQFNNIPYQTYVDRGYFRLVESKYNKPDGSVNISIKTVVFQKGIDFINKLLNKDSI